VIHEVNGGFFSDYHQNSASEIEKHPVGAKNRDFYSTSFTFGNDILVQQEGIAG